jgi:hypothetical protein
MTNNQISNLTDLERYYFNVMRSGNVLYLMAPPATAKSSLMRSIAEKAGYNYIDLRLSTADESDFAIPSITHINGIAVTENAIPKWVMEANARPTLIHFEELNRCRKEIQDAALGILLERVVGGTKLNAAPDVLICSSGNLGEEDGTDVEEFDAALRNRLVMCKHELTHDYWLENFANENVHEAICGFIKAVPEYFYRTNEKDTGQYATPRSWTMLSNYICTVYGKDSPATEWINEIAQIGTQFVGTSILKFQRWVEETSVFNVNDIVNNYKTVRKQVQEAGRGKLDEMLNALREFNVSKLKIAQIKNIVQFLKDNKNNQDNVAGYIDHILSTIEPNDMLENKSVKTLMSELADDYEETISNAMGM